MISAYLQSLIQQRIAKERAADLAFALRERMRRMGAYDNPYMNGRAERMFRSTSSSERAKAAALLDVDIDADAATVKAAFRKTVREGHPDNGGSAVDMDALTKAKELLLTPMPETGVENENGACKLCNGVGMVQDGFSTRICVSCRGTGHAF